MQFSLVLIFRYLRPEKMACLRTYTSTLALLWLFLDTTGAQTGSVCLVTDSNGAQVQGGCFDQQFAPFCAYLNMTSTSSSSCTGLGQICCYVPNSNAGLVYTSYSGSSSGSSSSNWQPGQNVCGVSMQNQYQTGGYGSGGYGGVLPVYGSSDVGGGGTGIVVSPRSDDMPTGPRSPRILGGNNVQNLSRYCWIAAISAGNNYIASGALLNSQWVITSANVVKQFASQNPFGSPVTQSLNVKLGQLNTNVGAGNVYQVVKVMLNPGFRMIGAGYPVHDVALLQLAAPVNFVANPSLCGACLPAPNHSFTSERCHAAGYGVSQETSSVIDGQLRDVLLPMIPRQVCDIIYRAVLRNSSYATDPSSLCAGGEQGRDTCLKDGGAPLTCIGVLRPYYVLAAVSSWGNGCGRYGTPSIYSDLSNQGVLSWIQNTAGPMFPAPATGSVFPGK